MKFLKMILLVPVFLSLYACAMVDSAGRESTSGGDSNAPRVYYAGISGLKMFSECRVSGSPIAELPLHEKVLRYKMERGFAYVKVVRTGQVGWVKNANLVWQKRGPSELTTHNNLNEKKSKVDPETTPGVTHEANPKVEHRDASMFDAL